MSDPYAAREFARAVLVLDCKIGALAIMRSLGSLGVPVYGVNDNATDAALKSRFLKKYFVQALHAGKERDFVDFLIALSREIGDRPVLIPTSDEFAIFVARFSAELSMHYIFSANSPELMENLADKSRMYHVALAHDIPTPAVELPRNLDELLAVLPEIRFPVMLKGIDGHRLSARTGKRMVIVSDQAELVEQYKLLEDPAHPNLMVQELIPGADDQVFIFNGYFNKESNCLAAFTGHKVRQYPVHLGCASLGECRWHEQVAVLTRKLMKAIGYQGILDIGYRLDPRDGQYKVLDINPRVGQAFRIFVAENNMDVVRSLYLDLTGQDQLPVEPLDGRRWLIEDFDILSTRAYFKEGSLTFRDWFVSLGRVREMAWFSWWDPLPALVMTGRFLKYGWQSCRKRIVRQRDANPSPDSRY